MRSKIYILIYILLTATATAYPETKTILTAKGYATNITFPDTVQEYAVGDESLFKSIRKINSNIVLDPKTDDYQTNLNVYTSNNIYVFILRGIDRQIQIDRRQNINVSRMPDLNVLINRNTESQGNHPATGGQTSTGNSRTENKQVVINENMSYEEKIGEYRMKMPRLFSSPARAYVTRYGTLIVSMEKILVQKENMYLVVKVVNDSKVTYKILDTLFTLNEYEGGFFSRGSLITSDPEAIEVKDAVIPEEINPRTTKLLVFVMRSVGVNDNTYLRFEMNEIAGNRSVDMEVKIKSIM